jgi:hypothetical protein
MTAITIKELDNIINRFPTEFYRIYSCNSFFKNQKIYKIHEKEYKKKNIIITENINNFYEETIIDVIEDYNDKDVIYLDRYGLQHRNFFDILNGLDNLEFNWNTNKFYYKDKHKKIHFLNINEKNNLIEYLQLKKDPFIETPIINTPTFYLYEKEESYFTI